MPERPGPDRQLPITRAHLFALGALSLSLAVLSFFVGLQVGRNESALPAATAPPVAPLVDAQARSGDLEALLAKVEQAGGAGATLEFPAELPRTDEQPTAPTAPTAPTDPLGAPPAPPVPPVDPFPDPQRSGTATVAAGVAAVVAPAVEVPRGGWAVQVATRADEPDAAVLADTLRAAGLAAYHVVALVDGRRTWRVRVGGFASRDAATAALPGVQSRSGSADATVTPAP